MADIFKSSFTGEEIEQILKKAQVLKDVSANPAKVSESNLVKIEIDGVVYSLPPYVSANVQQPIADDLKNIKIGDRVLGLPQIPYIEPNPAQEPTQELNKVKIDSIVYSLPQPTEQVEANPTDEGTEILSKLKVGNKTYTILSAGAPIEISTEAAMDVVLAGAQVGAVFKYIGTTTSKYENGALYVVEEEVERTYSLTITNTGNEVLYYGIDEEHIGEDVEAGDYFQIWAGNTKTIDGIKNYVYCEALSFDSSKYTANNCTVEFITGQYGGVAIVRPTGDNATVSLYAYD